MITPKLLGEVLKQEFERDKWGTVDPFYFDQPAGEQGEYEGLSKILERVAERLNKEAS